MKMSFNDAAIRQVRLNGKEKTPSPLAKAVPPRVWCLLLKRP